MSTISPVATNLASLGITPSQPALTVPPAVASKPAVSFPPASQPAVASQPAAPVVTTPIATPAVPGTSTPNAPTPNAQVNTGYSSTPAPVTGGGEFRDAIAKGLSGISAMVAGSSSIMDNVNKSMQAKLTASGGQPSPADLQMAQSQMSMAETTMQMAKSIQDKQDQINQIWARA